MKFLILFTFFTLPLYANYTDSFVVKISPDLIKVSSPKVYKKNVSLIIENKSMVKLLGKIASTDGEIEKMVVVKSNDFASVNLILDKNRELYFVPLSPPFQKIKLKFGQKSYEIPPKE